MAQVQGDMGTRRQIARHDIWRSCFCALFDHCVWYHHSVHGQQCHEHADQLLMPVHQWRWGMSSNIVYYRQLTLHVNRCPFCLTPRTLILLIYCIRVAQRLQRQICEDILAHVARTLTETLQGHSAILLWPSVSDSSYHL